MCRTEFVPDDNPDEPLTCDRDGVHIVHRSDAAGVQFRRSLRGGAEVTDARK